jgi:hypothetical protein
VADHDRHLSENTWVISNFVLMIFSGTNINIQSLLSLCLWWYSYFKSIWFFGYSGANGLFQDNS